MPHITRHLTFTKPIEAVIPTTQSSLSTQVLESTTVTQVIMNGSRHEVKYEIAPSIWKCKTEKIKLQRQHCEAKRYLCCSILPDQQTLRQIPLGRIFPYVDRKVISGV